MSSCHVDPRTTNCQRNQSSQNGGLGQNGGVRRNQERVLALFRAAERWRKEAGVLKAYRIDGGNLQRNRATSSTRGSAQGAMDRPLRCQRRRKGVGRRQPSSIQLSPVNDYEPFQVSSHYSATEHQLTMTGLLLIIREDNEPHLLKITFIRAKDVLVTVSDGGRRGLSELIKECENCFTHKSGRDDIFAALLDMIVDHTDNILDKVGHDLDRINTHGVSAPRDHEAAAAAARLAAPAQPPARARADRPRAEPRNSGQTAPQRAQLPPHDRFPARTGSAERR